LEETVTKTINGEVRCVYCKKKAKSKSRGSMHNGDWEEFWACNCEDLQSARYMQKRINDYESKLIDLRLKNKDYFKALEYKSKLKILQREYGLNENTK